MPPVTPSRILRGCGAHGADYGGGQRTRQTTPTHTGIPRAAWLTRAVRAHFAANSRQSSRLRPELRHNADPSQGATETADVDSRLAGSASGRGKSCCELGRRRADARRSCWRSCCAPGCAARARWMWRAALLAEFGSLRGLLTADRERVCAARGLGPARYVALQAALELARRHYQELMRTGSALANPRATREFLQMRLRDLPHEVFCCLLSGQPPPGDRVRGAVPRHHRRRQRPPAGGGQAGAGPQRGGGDPGPQPSLRAWPSPARPTN